MANDIVGRIAGSAKSGADSNEARGAGPPTSAQPNHSVQATAYSVRCAPAFSRAWRPALSVHKEAELLYYSHMRDEFLTKAKENLKAAEILFEHQLYNAAVSRAYYAAFQAAIAALADQGIATGRRGHATIQANFATELIQRRKRYPRHFRAYLMDLQSVRDDADYKLQSVSSRVARRQLTKAKEFVEAIVREFAP